MADVKLFDLGGVVVSDTTQSEVINVIDSAEFILRYRINKVTFSIALTGGSVIAFDAFDVQGQFVNGGPWHTMASDFGTSGAGFLFFSPDDLDALAHGATGICTVTTNGLFAIRFRSAQAGPTAVAVTRTLEVSTIRFY